MKSASLIFYAHSTGREFSDPCSDPAGRQRSGLSTLHSSSDTSSFSLISSTPQVHGTSFTKSTQLSRPSKSGDEMECFLSTPVSGTYQRELTDPKRCAHQAHPHRSSICPRRNDSNFFSTHPPTHTGTNEPHKQHPVSLEERVNPLSQHYKD